MSTKEFIKNQVERFTTPVTPDQFTELSEMENSILILEVSLKDYTLTEIARIVENNNARILALTVLPISDGTDLLVSLKLDANDLTAIRRSFERFDYHVVYYFSREEEVTDVQQERLAELLYYLEM